MRLVRFLTWRFAALPCFGADRKGSMTIYQRNRGYVFVMGALMFTYFFNLKKIFFLNNRGAFLIGSVFISYDR